MEAKAEKMPKLFTEDLEELRNKQMNNTLEGINSRITEAEEQISDLEDKMTEITATKENITKQAKLKKETKTA